VVGRPMERPPSALHGLLAGISNAALARFARSLQRQPAPTATLTLSPDALATFGIALPELAIEGPLPAGTVRESHGVTVRQVDAQHAEIEYGESWVRIAADPTDRYAYSIGPPIEGPPKPPSPLGPLVGLPDPDAKPELAQRLVVVTATRPIVEERIDEAARVAPLAVHTRYVGPSEVPSPGIGLVPGLEVVEHTADDHAQLELEDSIVRIEVAGNAAAVAGDAKRARFAYWIDPEWTGLQATEKRVVIVAAPGVAVRTGSPGNAPVVRYGRTLVPEIVRVPHPKLVPEQGTRFGLEQFVDAETVDPDAPSTEPLLGPVPDSGQHTNKVDIGTGLAGVAIVHPWSGARLSLRPSDPDIGAAYAWQVLPPENGLPGEIRAIVGPGVDVELQEPVPQRLRDPYGATPTPRKGEAWVGEGLEEQSLELKLVEVVDPALVPVQGTPLNVEHFLRAGGRFREPDRHVWLGTNDLPSMLATAGFDLIVGAIPIIGPLYLIGQFAYTMATGHDWWGHDVDEGGKVLMGVGAAISLIPLVGGLGAVLRGGAKAAVIAEVAARWGTTTEELQAVLVRVGAATEGDDAAIVHRAMRAIERGSQFPEEDVPALERILAKVGAGHLGLEGIARSGIGRLDLALAAADAPLRSENYLANLMSAYRTTGEVPESLAVPLARSGQFGNAEEAQAAVQQALRDLARAEGVAASEPLIAEVASRAGEAMSRVQAAGLDVVPVARELAVSRPELVAEYERLVDERLPAVMRDVLSRQRATPNRTRLAQLRTQLDQLRRRVGDARQLTDAQRDLANQILRDARQAAEADWGNVRTAVWRRLRNPRRNPDLAAIEQQLRAAGDVQGPRTGALSVRTRGATGDLGFQEMNIEHRVRRSDNPWLYNDPENLLLTDAAQNQQYLESLRQQGSIWPSDAVEEFVVRFGLNDQGIDFGPRGR
jgi:hypothetical protein